MQPRESQRASRFRHAPHGNGDAVTTQCACTVVVERNAWEGFPEWRDEDDEAQAGKTSDSGRMFNVLYYIYIFFMSVLPKHILHAAVQVIGGLAEVLVVAARVRL
jgi:hypothetical protein